MDSKIKLHKIFKTLEVVNAKLKHGDLEYEYIYISDTEFQLGLKGDILTNYVVK